MDKIGPAVRNTPAKLLIQVTGLTVDLALRRVIGITKLEYGSGAVFDHRHPLHAHRRNGHFCSGRNNFDLRREEPAAKTFLKEFINTIQSASGMNTGDHDRVLFGHDHKTVISQIIIRRKPKCFAGALANKNVDLPVIDTVGNKERLSCHLSQILCQFLRSEAFCFIGIRRKDDGGNSILIP